MQVYVQEHINLTICFKCSTFGHNTEEKRRCAVRNAGVNIEVKTVGLIYGEAQIALKWDKTQKKVYTLQEMTTVQCIKKKVNTQVKKVQSFLPHTCTYIISQILKITTSAVYIMYLIICSIISVLDQVVIYYLFVSIHPSSDKHNPSKRPICWKLSRFYKCWVLRSIAKFYVKQSIGRVMNI